MEHKTLQEIIKEMDVKPTPQSMIVAVERMAKKVVDEKTKEMFDGIEEKMNEFYSSLEEKIISSLENAKGDKGDAPQKNVDYFDGHTPTDEELLRIIKPLIPVAKDGEPGHTPTANEILALVRPLIPKVKDGATPTKEELLALIKPLVPDIKDADTPQHLL